MMMKDVKRLTCGGSAILLYSESERTIAEEVVHRMVKRAVEMEGTVTVSLTTVHMVVLFPALLTWEIPPLQGEHGVGLVKRDYLPHELGASTVDAMRKVRDRASISPTEDFVIL